MTERAGRAYDITHTEIKKDDFDGVVTVSEEGLIHEVINGLYRRKVWVQLMSTLTLLLIPGRTANELI
jgi:diacylglycerol kinase family enzyme